MPETLVSGASNVAETAMLGRDGRDVAEFHVPWRSTGEAADERRGLCQTSVPLSGRNSHRPAKLSASCVFEKNALDASIKAADADFCEAKLVLPPEREA